MSSVTAALTCLGFDRSRLPFGARTAITGWLALVAATLLHLDSPHWAAMTVWVVAQPTRGMLLEKSVHRVIGTVIGSLVGVVLLMQFGATPILLVAGLAVWVGLCACLGNVLRHAPAYGVILAGYTAALVALVDVPHPDHVVTVAAMRVATIIVGVVLSTVVGGLLTPVAGQDDLMGRVRRVGAETLGWAAAALDGAPFDRLTERERRVVADMAAIEDALHLQVAGSRGGHRRGRHIRGLFAALLSLIASVRTVTRRQARNEVTGRAVTGGGGLALLIHHLDAAAADLAGGAALCVPFDVIRAALGDPRAAGTLDDALARVTAAFEAISDDHAGLETSREGRPTLSMILHRDWIGARAAMIRAVAAIAVVGAAWLGSGWPYGQFMLLSTCIMTTVFSAFENPVEMLRHVRLGSAAGSAVAIMFRLILLPLAGSDSDVVLMALPVLLLGGMAMAHHRTSLAALDYTMCFLLLAPPVFPPHGTPEAVMNGAVAILLGITVAQQAFRFVLPLGLSSRLRALMVMTVRDLEGLAGGGAIPDPLRWQARLHHRILRLVRGVDAAGERNLLPVDGGIAALTVAAAIVRLRALIAADDRLPAGCGRALRLAVARLSRLSHSPEAAAAALERAASRLMAADAVTAEMFRDAADALKANRAFFAWEIRARRA